MTRRLETCREAVDALSAAGWGDLAGADNRALRITLDTLATMSKETGRVVITAWQLAQRMGYSERWTRHALHRLEAMHLVRWTRGHIEQGQPRPGWIQVSRARLCQLLDHARALHRWATREHSDETRERIAKTVRNATLWPRKSASKAHRPLSSQPELATTLPPLQGVEGRAPHPGAPALQQETPMDRRECEHGTRIGAYCGMCNYALHHPATATEPTVSPSQAPTRETTAKGLALVRAALRQAKHEQDPLA